MQFSLNTHSNTAINTTHKESGVMITNYHHTINAHCRVTGYPKWGFSSFSLTSPGILLYRLELRFGIIKVATEDYLVLASSTVDYADASALKIEAVCSSRNLSNFYQTASRLCRQQTSIKIPIPTYFHIGTAVDLYEADIWLQHKLDCQLSQGGDLRSSATLRSI